jgi:class 3 adenylate cyclase
LAIQVGFHHGAVIEELGEFLGECVNTAESLAGLAGAGQVLTSSATQVAVVAASAVYRHAP